MFESLSRFVVNKPENRSEQPQSYDEIYARVKQLVERDINATRNEYFFPASQWILDNFMSNKRPLADAPLFYALFNVLVACVVNLLLIYFYTDMSWYLLFFLSAARIAVFGTPRFVLALHAASHTPIIEPKWFSHFYLNFILGTFMGIPCGSYPTHHITMHHKEDNQFPLDLSSTMPYQRDNFLHFIFYWFRFEFGVWIEMPAWLLYKGYMSTLAELAVGIFLWWSVVISSWIYIRPAVSICVFIAPQFVMSFLLMFGNWSQHVFIDPERFADDHVLTVNCIDSAYNQATFNDGYHIVHHKYPYLHWSELPKKFIEESQFKTHGKANALCFKSVDWFWIGVFVMTGNLDRLSGYLVPITEEQSRWTIAETSAHLRSRLVPIHDPKAKTTGYNALFGLVDLLFGVQQ